MKKEEAPIKYRTLMASMALAVMSVNAPCAETIPVTIIDGDRTFDIEVLDMYMWGTDVPKSFTRPKTRLCRPRLKSFS